METTVKRALSSCAVSIEMSRVLVSIEVSPHGGLDFAAVRYRSLNATMDSSETVILGQCSLAIVASPPITSTASVLEIRHPGTVPINSGSSRRRF